MSDMIDLEELKQFAAFEKLGTLSKVAEEFHISTPSITRSMKNIEEAMGVELFNRSKNRIELNETGKIAVGYATKLLQEADNMVSQVRAFDQRRRTIVVNSSAPAPLWELMKILSAKHPGKTISSSISQNDDVIQALQQKKCDIAILPFVADISGYKVKQFMKEKLYVLVGKEHELAKHESLRWEDINGFNFLLRTELGFWDVLCRSRMPASKFLIQPDTEVFDEVVRAFTLPCFITDYISSDTYPGRVKVPINEKDADVTFYLLEKYF